MNNTTITAAPLALEIDELESLEAPGFWDSVGGFAAGVAVGAVAVGIGIAIT